MKNDYGGTGITPNESLAQSDHDAEAGRPCLRWSVQDNDGLLCILASAGLVHEGHIALAREHADATGSTIAHSLIHIGAITQRQLLAVIENPGSYADR